MDLIIYVLIGFLFIILAFVIWYIIYAIVRVPDDDTNYLDKPPLFYRLLKLPINVVAFYITPWLNKAMIDKYEKAIIFAGVEYQFKPEHIIASKILGAVVLGFVFLLLLWVAGQSSVFGLLAMLLGFIYPDLWLKQTKQTRNAHIAKNIPFFLDMITLSIESGLNLNGKRYKKDLMGRLRQNLKKYYEILRQVLVAVRQFVRWENALMTYPSKVLPPPLFKQKRWV